MLCPFWHTFTSTKVLALGHFLYALYWQLRQELPSWVRPFLAALISQYFTYGHRQFKFIPIPARLSLSLTLCTIRYLSYSCVIVCIFISILQMPFLHIDCCRVNLNLLKNSIICLEPTKEEDTEKNKIHSKKIFPEIWRRCWTHRYTKWTAIST